MRRPIEIGIEIAITLAIVVGLYVWATYVPESRDIGSKWVGFFGCTTFLFGYFLYWARGKNKDRRYWGIWCGALVMHLLIFVPLLNAVKAWPLVLFSFTTLAELAVIAPLLNRELSLGRNPPET